MEKLTNKAARRYLRQVRQLLPCSRSMKDKITAPLRQSISDFLAEQPEADTQALQLRFGAAEAIAASCLENTDTAAVLRQLRVKRQIVKAVLAAIMILLLAWGAFEVYAAIRLRQYLDGDSLSELDTRKAAEASYITDSDSDNSFIQEDSSL